MPQTTCGATALTVNPADLTRHRVIVATAAWSSREWRFGRDGGLVVRIDPAMFCSTNDARMLGPRSSIILSL